jgi:orotate phosphoribosyltransferase
MTEAQIRQTLQDKGSLFPPEDGGHFVGISGKHLSGYCNIDPALPDVNFIKTLTRQLVEPFAKARVETVLVPAIGAIPLAAWGPHFLQELTGDTVAGVWADKVKPRGFVLERNGFEDAVAGKRVLILEDIVNQMFSVKELIRMTRELNGEVVGVGALVANGTASAEKMGIDHFERMCEFNYDAWEPADCELCAKHVPIVTDPALGHGSEFQEQHPDYPGGFVNRPRS